MWVQLPEAVVFFSGQTIVRSAVLLSLFFYVATGDISAKLYLALAPMPYTGKVQVL